MVGTPQCARAGLPGALNAFQDVLAGSLPRADSAFNAWQLSFAWPCTTD